MRASSSWRSPDEEDALAIRALRAGGRLHQPPFQMGDLEIIPSELRARRGDEVIDLSLREVGILHLGILHLLHEHRGRVVDRDTFFNRLWGFEHAPQSRTLDQQVAKLRKRIEVAASSRRAKRDQPGTWKTTGRRRTSFSGSAERGATRSGGDRLVPNQNGTPFTDAARFAVANNLGRASSGRGS